MKLSSVSHFFDLNVTFKGVCVAACMLLMCGCVTSRTGLTRDILPTFEPSDEEGEKVEKFMEWLKVQPNRMEVIHFVEERLGRPFLTVRTQLRLGMLLGGVERRAQADEYQLVRAVITKGAKLSLIHI